MPTPLPRRPTHQYAMTFVAPVDQTSYQSLSELLEHINQQTIQVMRGAPPSAVVVPFHEVESLHYGRFLLVAASPEHGDPAMLVLSTNYDGPEGAPNRDVEGARARHLKQLVDAAGAGLNRVLQYCRGGKADFSKEELLAFLGRPEHQVPANTFYVGSSGRSKRQILGEFELRKHIELAADWVRATLPHIKDPEQLRDAIKKKLQESGTELPPSFPPQPDGRLKIALVAGPILLALLGTLGGVVPLGLYVALGGMVPLALLVLVGLSPLAIAYFYLRHLEKTDPVEEPQHNAATRNHTIEASTGENLFMQNQLTHLVDLKPGLFRYGLINAVFFALQLLATNYYNKGKLGNIPSIHFARWVFLGKAKRLLFFSNFDNSWQSYLGDFVDQASSGLTAVWSNTKGYPRTENLLNAGSRNSTAFLAWTRAHQLPTNVWYSAYPALGIKNVNANTQLRRGLAGATDIPASDWLKLLGGQDLSPPGPSEKPDPRPPALQLPHDNIQGLILKGYGFLPHARYVMLRIGDRRSAARWFASLPITVVSGASRNDHPEERHASLCFVNLALTYRGLQSLGLDTTLLSAFPPEFVQGASHPNRSRILGDDGRNAPSNWQWGNSDNPVDAILLLFTKSNEEAERQLKHYLEAASAAGLTEVKVLHGCELPGRKEHFGFRDGIAQPRVQAANSTGHGSTHDLNAMAPGEFLLGYPDNYRGVSDTGLANVTFAPKTAKDFEFCKGGSYLVFRQLQQDVPAFWTYCASASEAPGSTLSAEAIASKMVGRWPNGEPLVLSPDAPKRPDKPSDQDAFGYLHNHDESGHKCPFSAHIRRSNPRDWMLGSDSTESVRLANLHRLMRRGRPYGKPLTEHLAPAEMQRAASTAKESTESRGLNFLCFNGNIERQFEFVQQQWVNNTQLTALVADGDPLMGRAGRQTDGVGGGDPSFTIQQDPLRLRCTGLSEFVTVVGSAYFLMPPLKTIRALPELVPA